MAVQDQYLPLRIKLGRHPGDLKIVRSDLLIEKEKGKGGRRVEIGDDTGEVLLRTSAHV